ncbi:MAG: NADH-quinone oxidoreductase subunit C [Deltaproteobacteria bacterium]|nr:NADH-quinone oxidoreductase subunit C [Deltaproteobacteria bacterium]
MDAFKNVILNNVQNGGVVLAFFGAPAMTVQNGVCIYAIIGTATTGCISVHRTEVTDAYPSLTPEVPQLHWFERELAEQWAITPEGHPWLKPIRFMQQAVNGKNILSGGKTVVAGVTDYYSVKGKEIHEVAVGPVHAGIIEPGHFRFQCHGETVFHLEIELGYQHRGIEKALVGGPDKRTPFFMETLAGDSSIAHGFAYSQLMGALLGKEMPKRALAIAACALELERLANHTGDLGALAGDIGYLPTLSFNGRLRGDYLNMTGLICGNRFGRNLVCPGGVMFDVSDATITELKKRLATIFKETRISCDLLWATPSVMARFENTGVVKKEDGIALGWVGPAARACGIDMDARAHFPFGAYLDRQMPVAMAESGDVYARAHTRWQEMVNSRAFIDATLNEMPAGATRTDVDLMGKDIPEKDTLVVSLTEGWRGVVCHAAITNREGRFAVYKVVDPSFHNWFALAMSLRDEQISDFPLCNKSFNLSYCGHDL